MRYAFPAVETPLRTDQVAKHHPYILKMSLRLTKHRCLFLGVECLGSRHCDTLKLLSYCPHGF